ncbi:uncharacterized protein G2W53_039645 [Senna tora]|uniref:Uncharacterized protein n=1 Tax=Senna tora TaxID=362788 RepID=A0A834W850_9FABA|nr:uncharacterized protein G2W53_039645 [Senna tora]
MPHGGRQLMSGGDVLVECWGCQSVQCHWKGCTVSRGGAAMVCDKTGGGWMAVMRGRLGGGDMLVECWGCQSAQCHWKGCKVFLSSAVSRGEDAMVCDKAGGGWMAMMRGRLDPSEGKWCLVRAVYRAFGPSFRIDLAWSVRRWCVVLPPFDLPTFDLFGVVLRGCYHASFGLTCYWIDFDFALPLAVVFRHSFGRFVAQFIGFRRTSVVPSAIWSLPSSYPPSFASFLSIFLVGPSFVRCSFDLSFTRSVGFRGTYAALSGIPLLPSSFPPSSLSVLSRTIHWLFRHSVCHFPAFSLLLPSSYPPTFVSLLSIDSLVCHPSAALSAFPSLDPLVSVVLPPFFRPFRRSIRRFRAFSLLLPSRYPPTFASLLSTNSLAGHPSAAHSAFPSLDPLVFVVLLPFFRLFRCYLRVIRQPLWTIVRLARCWASGLHLLFPQERARSPATLGFWSSLGFFARTAIWGPEEAKVAVMLVMDVLGVVSHQVYSVLGGYSVTWALQCGTDGTVATLRWYYDGTDGTVTGRVEVSRPTCGTVTRQRPD